MIVIFEDRYGRERELAEVQTREEVEATIFAFLDKYKYKPYYVRKWTENKEYQFYIVYDVGSHSEFFKVKLNSEKEISLFIP